MATSATSIYEQKMNKLLDRFFALHPVARIGILLVLLWLIVVGFNILREVW